LEIRIEQVFSDLNSGVYVLREAPDVGSFASVARRACGTETAITLVGCEPIAAKCAPSRSQI
jgi:hypothetical protein